MNHHRKEHSLLLISQLFEARQRLSPFTVILDSLEQSGRSLVEEFILRAKGSNVRVILLSLESLWRPQGVTSYIRPGRTGIPGLLKDVDLHLSQSEETLIVTDSLNVLAEIVADSLPGFLWSLMRPKTSLIGTFHTDVPVRSTKPESSSSYTPHTLTILRYLATTILTTHCLSHVLEQKRARDRSLPEPMFGLAEHTEGVLAGRGSNDQRAMVVELEYRRKSGRGVTEWYVMSGETLSSALPSGGTRPSQKRFSLLENHPLYNAAKHDIMAREQGESQAHLETSFNLGLSQKQRIDREGVVLPYFDAQKTDTGAAEGGRILYDMGVEDDFDEEEDEI